MSVSAELERAYDHHSQALFAYLLNLTRHWEDTREVLQEVFARLSARPELLHRAEDERAFLIRLAHNLAIDHIRRRQSRQRREETFGQEKIELFAPATNPDESTFQNEVSTALGQLPEDQRAVVHLKLWEQLTFDQIAEIHGISPNTAASRYRYGIDKLRELLRPLYQEIIK